MLKKVSLSILTFILLFTVACTDTSSDEDIHENEDIENSSKTPEEIYIEQIAETNNIRIEEAYEQNKNHSKVYLDTLAERIFEANNTQNNATDTDETDLHEFYIYSDLNKGKRQNQPTF